MLKRILVLGAVFICLGAAAAEAGMMYKASCGACGFTSADLHVGCGMYPFGRHGLYCARDWKTVVIVFFDLRKLLPPGTDPGPNAGPDACGAACDKYLGGWTYPAVIAAGKLPSYATVATAAYQGKPIPRLALVEDGAPLDRKSYTCPRCGKVKLIFTKTGLWD